MWRTLSTLLIRLTCDAPSNELVLILLVCTVGACTFAMVAEKNYVSELTCVLQASELQSGMSVILWRTYSSVQRSAACSGWFTAELWTIGT
jgi:hypothetical protein